MLINTAVLYNDDTIIMFLLMAWSISKQAACCSHFQFLSNATGTAVNKARCRFATNTFNASKIVLLLFSLNQSSRPLIPAKQFLATLKGQCMPEQGWLCHHLQTEILGCCCHRKQYCTAVEHPEFVSDSAFKVLYISLSLAITFI